jgi:hypothetical protein
MFIKQIYRQKVLVALQKAQATSVLSQAVAARECSSSRLGALSSLPPLSLVDMLHAIAGGFNT